jgi:hypothetical protein
MEGRPNSPELSDESFNVINNFRILLDGGLEIEYG